MIFGPKWRLRVQKYAVILLVISAVQGQADTSSDIQALTEYSREAQRAALRLVDRGTSILPEAHRLLQDKEPQPPKLLLQLVTVVGEIGHPASIVPLIAVARNHPDNTYINHNALLELARMPPTSDAVAFANEVLASSRTFHAKRTALYFFATHKLSPTRARSSVKKAQVDELRDAELYLQARLGNVTAKTSIMKMLKQKPGKGIEYNLLSGLGEIVDAEEFISMTKNLDHNSYTYRSALRLAQLRTGPIAERSKLANKMLRSQIDTEQRTAVRYLLKSGDSNLLKKYFSEKRLSAMERVIRGEARRQGIQVIGGGKTVEFQTEGLD